MKPILTDLQLSADPIWLKVILSLVLIVAMWVVRTVFRKRLQRLSVVHAYESHRLFLLKKIVGVLFWLVSIIALLTVWGVDPENIWVYLGGFLSVLAVGFFAVWSILSNIVAGVLIFILNPFKIGSKIRLYDPEVEATVTGVNLLFTELEDGEGRFNVPNNFFFQKTVKVLKPGAEQ